MSALSSTTSTFGRSSTLVRRGRVGVEPAQRLGDEARGDLPGGRRLAHHLLGRQVLGAERDGHGEARSLARHALHRHRAAVQLGQLGHQREPDAACPRRCASGRRSTRWKRSNRRSWSAGSIPIPVSVTVSRAAPSVASKDTVMLGLLTGILAFLPNIGAIISGALIILIGFS